MSSATLEPVALPIAVDPLLLKAVTTSVGNALSMCELTAKCVSISAVPAHEPGLVTGIIGVHGKVSGFVTVNMAERFAIRAVEGLLQDKFGALTNQVIDGAGELTNIVVGGIKSVLGNSSWSFSQITVPSVIVGQGYQIAYSKGLEFLNVTFEHQDPDAVLLQQRIFNVSVSLLRL